jgi:hypothetical protein
MQSTEIRGHLNRFTQTHFIPQYTANLLTMQFPQPPHGCQLIWEKLESYAAW